jgi:replication factor C subunit 1
MDEVDGCGAGDRGGISALIAIIKESKTPIICICNDNKEQKLKTLITYCYELKFTKPNQNAIKKRISDIVENESLQISSE